MNGVILTQMLKMKDEPHQQDKLALLSFWLIMPVVIALLTWLCFNAILYYYAPYGSAIAFPIAKLREKLEVVATVEVWDETKVIQPFIATLNGLERIDFQVVTWGDRPRSHNVFWQLNEIGDDRQKAIKRHGSFQASSIKDWGFVHLEFKPILDSACKSYEVLFSAPGTPQPESIGFPIFKAQDTLVPEARPIILSEPLQKSKAHLQGYLRGSLFFFYRNFGR